MNAVNKTIPRTIILLFSLSVLSCSIFDNEEQDLLNSSSIEIISVDPIDTSQVLINIKVNSENIAQVDYVGYLLYDEFGNKIDSINLRVNAGPYKYPVSVKDLERGKTFQIQFYAMDREIETTFGERTEIFTRSVMIYSYGHQNSYPLTNYSVGGVMPKDTLWVYGSGLKDYQDNYELSLDFLDDHLKIIRIDDHVIEFWVDTTYNHHAEGGIRRFPIYIIDKSDTIANYQNDELLIYTDSPHLLSASVESGYLEIGGSFGNWGCDSVFVGDKKMNTTGGKANPSTYYHQMYEERVSIENLEPGVYTVTVYLNGYKDTIENVDLTGI